MKRTLQPPPIGEKIAIAGHVWVIEDIDHKRHVVYCEQIKGKVPAYFGECPGDIHTKILERMRQVLREDTQYPYLMAHAAARLQQARHAARSSGVTEHTLICLGGDMWCLFPWMGTYAFLALERLLKVRCAGSLKLSGLSASRPYFIQFKMQADRETFFRVLQEEARRPLDSMELVYPKELPLFEKYDEFLPESLVRKGFAYGVLAVEEMKACIQQWNR